MLKSFILNAINNHNGNFVVVAVGNNYSDLIQIDKETAWSFVNCSEDGTFYCNKEGDMLDIVPLSLRDAYEGINELDETGAFNCAAQPS